MTRSWTYSHEHALDDSCHAALSLHAHSAVDASLGTHVLFATSQLALNLSLLVDQVTPAPGSFGTSALVREVVEWLTQNVARIGLDVVGLPTALHDVVTIPLYVATSSARASRLAIECTAPPPPFLSSISLSFEFRSTGDSASSDSQSTAEGSLPEGLLANQLLAAAPAALHFALARLVHSALANLFTTLSNTFPLCFNPAWVERLTHDLGSFRSVANSLSRILDRANLVSSGELDLDELELARGLPRQLVSTFSRPRLRDDGNDGNDNASPSSSRTARWQNGPSSASCDDSVETNQDERRAIESALVLVAKQATHLVDPPTLSPPNAPPATATAKATKTRTVRSARGSARGGGNLRGRGRRQVRARARGRGEGHSGGSSRAPNDGGDPVRKSRRKRRTRGEDGSFHALDGETVEASSTADGQQQLVGPSGQTQMSEWVDEEETQWEWENERESEWSSSGRRYCRMDVDAREADDAEGACGEEMLPF